MTLTRPTAEAAWTHAQEVFAATEDDDWTPVALPEFVWYWAETVALLWNADTTEDEAQWELEDLFYGVLVAGDLA
jgi:hypothetical protein